MYITQYKQFCTPRLYIWFGCGFRNIVQCLLCYVAKAKKLWMVADRAERAAKVPDSVSLCAYPVVYGKWLLGTEIMEQSKKEELSTKSFRTWCGGSVGVGGRRLGNRIGYVCAIDVSTIGNV